jgi:hypothetical protein
MVAYLWMKTNEIIIIDNENNQSYFCKLHISKSIPNKIYIGKGWRKYIKDNNLKPYDNLMFILSKPPTSIQVSIVDRN